MYDWANSVYSLTITTAILPPYFSAVTGGTEGTIFGIKNSSIYAYILSLSFLTIACLNPILSAIADTGGNRKKFMQFFSLLGSTSCALLFFFDENNIWSGLVFTATACIGFCGSLVFYNTYLPEIVSEDLIDKISARGFSLGYIGSVLLLIINLVMIQDIFPDSKYGAKLSFVTVGFWWFLFAQYSFSGLPQDKSKKTPDNIIKKSFVRLLVVWRQLQRLDWTRKFLYSFFFYSMGTQTVMYMATLFGEQVVKMTMTELILLVLLLQLIAIGGSYLFSIISKAKGNTYSILLSISIWILICISASFIQEGMKLYFYIIGAFVGLVMGGIQSMSRSTFAKLIPLNTNMKTSYYSFYETLEKFAMASGTFVFGFISHLTGSMTYSALFLSIFFIIGFLILIQIPSKKSYSIKL